MIAQKLKWAVGDELKISGPRSWHTFIDTPNVKIIDVIPEAVFPYYVDTGHQKAWVHQNHLTERDATVPA